MLNLSHKEDQDKISTVSNNFEIEKGQLDTETVNFDNTDDDSLPFELIFLKCNIITDQ